MFFSEPAQFLKTYCIQQFAPWHRCHPTTLSSSTTSTHYASWHNALPWSHQKHCTYQYIVFPTLTSTGILTPTVRQHILPPGSMFHTGLMVHGAIPCTRDIHLGVASCASTSVIQWWPLRLHFNWLRGDICHLVVGPGNGFSKRFSPFCFFCFFLTRQRLQEVTTATKAVTNPHSRHPINTTQDITPTQLQQSDD